jgi:hypothetical protein
MLVLLACTQTVLLSSVNRIFITLCIKLFANCQTSLQSHTGRFMFVIVSRLLLAYIACYTDFINRMFIIFPLSY